MARAKTAVNLASALVKDPASPPATTFTVGYLGASPFDGHERLYLCPDLGQYIDIPADDLLHRVPVPNEPLGATYVWIQQGSKLVYKGGQPIPDSPEEAAEDQPPDGQGAAENSPSPSRDASAPGPAKTGPAKTGPAKTGTGSAPTA